MAATEPGTPPVRARTGNTGEHGRRHPAMRRSHHPRGEELPVNHLGSGGLDQLALVRLDDAL